MFTSITGYLKAPLDEYIAANFTKVRLIRSEERLGLIRARMAGAKYAKGDVSICYLSRYFIIFFLYFQVPLDSRKDAYIKMCDLQRNMHNTHIL